MMSDEIQNETPKPKKEKSRVKGKRKKSGARLPALEEKGRREKAFEVFLASYRITGKVQRSAALAGVSCRAIQKWRQEFPEFEEEFRESHIAWVEHLKTEIYRRAVEGWDEPVYQKGELVGTVRKFDSKLLMYLTSQADPSFRTIQPAAQVNIANALTTTTNNIHGNVTIIEDSDWYGNKAHNMAAEAATAHLTDSSLTSEIQTSRLRETVEQDGNGDAGGTAGAR